MLKTCLFLTGLPLLFALGLLFFLGFEQSSGSQPEPFPFPQVITAEPFMPITPYEFVTPTGPPLLESAQMTATAIIRAATETAQYFLNTPTPTFGSPTALPEFGATPTPTPT